MVIKVKVKRDYGRDRSHKDIILGRKVILNGEVVEWAERLW